MFSLFQLHQRTLGLMIKRGYTSIKPLVQTFDSTCKRFNAAQNW